MGAAAIPIVLAVVSMGMQMKAAQEAKEAGEIERKQAEQRAAAIKTEGANQEAKARLQHYRRKQAAIAQFAAQGQRMDFLGTQDAFARFDEKSLELDVAIIRSNAEAGIRTAGLQGDLATTEANRRALGHYGQAAATGYQAYSGFSTQTTTS